MNELETSNAQRLNAIEKVLISLLSQLGPHIGHAQAEHLALLLRNANKSPTCSNHEQ